MKEDNYELTFKSFGLNAVISGDICIITTSFPSLVLHIFKTRKQCRFNRQYNIISSVILALQILNTREFHSPHPSPAKIIFFMLFDYQIWLPRVVWCRSLGRRHGWWCRKDLPGSRWTVSTLSQWQFWGSMDRKCSPARNLRRPLPSPCKKNIYHIKYCFSCFLALRCDPLKPKN